MANPSFRKYILKLILYYSPVVLDPDMIESQWNSYIIRWKSIDSIDSHGSIFFFWLILGFFSFILGVETSDADVWNSRSLLGLGNAGFFLHDLARWWSILFSFVREQGKGLAKGVCVLVHPYCPLKYFTIIRKTGLAIFENGLYASNLKSRGIVFVCVTSAATRTTKD